MRRALEAFLLGFLLLAGGAARALDPARPLTLYDLDVWRDGLPQYTVRTILQSSDGYLWLGTFEGLVRFDGQRFEVFDRSNVPAMRSWRIRSFCEQPTGTLWIGTVGGGLLRYRAGAFTSFTTAEGLPDDTIQTLRATRDGTLWMGTDGGLGRLRGERLESLKAVVGATVWGLAEDRDGALLVGSKVGLFRVRDDVATAVPLNGNLPVPVNSVDVSEDGTIWVGTELGLYRLKGGALDHWDRTSGLPATSVTGVLVDSRGSVWVATSPGGLARFDARFDARSARFETLDRKAGLPSDGIRALWEDREGSLWIGTDRGLARLKDLKFVNYSMRQGLREDNVRVVTEGADGSLWVGTEGGGVNVLSGGSVRVVGGEDGLSSPHIRAFAWDPDGSLWIGAGGGLFKVARLGARVVEVGEEVGLRGHKVDALYMPRDGALLVATEDTGLQRFHGGRFESVDFAGAGPLRNIRVLLDDGRGRLWLGTQDRGLLETKDGALVKTWTDRDGLASRTVFALAEDPDRTLWIGTHDGLSRLKEGRISSVGTAQGLPEGAVFQILDDPRGFLWLTSNRGLFRVSRASLDAVLEGRARRVVATAFGRRDGLGSDQCNGATHPAGIRTRDGRFAIPTAGGLTLVDPGDLHLNPVPPPVRLRDVKVNDRSLGPAPGSLAWTSERFEFHYDGLSLLQPERVTFRYRVDGYDRDWVDADTRRVAFYSSLPAGRHTFRVEARNNDGVWSASAATVSFELATPPWRSWWALASFALLGIGALGASIRVREGVLRRRNEALQAKVEERTRELSAALRRVEASEARAIEASRAKGEFLANMSHELRTPLNAVLGFAQLLEGDPRFRGEEALRIIHRSGEHLLGLINDVLSIAKIEAGSLELVEKPFDLRELLAVVQGIVGARAETKDLELGFDVDPTVPRWVRGDEGKLRQVLINLLGNSVKFTERGRVTLRARFADERTTFEVEDTGPGIAAEELSRLFMAFSQTESGKSAQEGTGLGLLISRRIVRLMGGDIRVASVLGKGSTFSFDVPLEAVPEPVERRSRRHVLGLAPGEASRRILVVDDTLENRLLLCRLLESRGFEVREAVNGAQALAEWERFRPQLVFMDMRMPVMDGREATGRIRAAEASGERPRTVIVSLTASAFEHERGELLRSGADDVMTKPFRVDALLDLLARHLGVRYRYEDDPAPTPSPSALPALLPGIDVAAGQRRAGGNRELYRRLLHGFVRELPDRLDVLRGAVARGELEDVAGSLHTLKGNAATLELRRVAAAAAALERALRESPASLDLAELVAAASEVSQSLEPFEDHDAPTSSGETSSAVDADRARAALPILDRLAQRLPTNELAVLDDFRELSDALAGQSAPGLAELGSALDRLDFDEAAGAVDRVRQSLGTQAES